MHYLCGHNIYFSTAYHLSVYDITYNTLGYTHPGIVTTTEKGEYIPSKKRMELERNFSLTLSSIHPEISLETQEIFYPEKSLRNQDMVI